MVLPALVQAQTAPVQSLSVLDSLKALPTVKEGFMWDFKQHRGLNTLGLELANSSFMANPYLKSFSLDLAWMGIDGIGAVAGYSLNALPIGAIPVLSYVKYLEIGYGLGWRTLTADTSGGNPKSDNNLIQGPVAFIKLKF